MKYLICRDVYEDYDDSIIYISTEEVTEKNDLVVYNAYSRPSLAKVINFMDELTAITSDYHLPQSQAPKASLGLFFALFYGYTWIKWKVVYQ